MRSRRCTAAERTPRGTAFPRELLAGPTLDAARALIGARLVRDDPSAGPRVGRIVEVEAYIGEDDRASHARFGQTARNEVMYAGPGLAYVYLVYGMYHCLNVVTEPAGRPAAVLIRAVEPLAGIDAMRSARVAHVRRSRKDPAAADVEAARVAGLPAHRLAAGPGLVGAAFTLGREHTGLDLCEPGSAIRLEPPVPADRRPDIVTTARVGIAYAGEPWTRMPWRFVDAGSPAISGLRTGRPRRSAPDRM